LDDSHTLLEDDLVGKKVKTTAESYYLSVGLLTLAFEGDHS
jgi:hypothetical protein